MKGRNAKKLCSMLITRALKELNEDEEDVVVDYLYEIGVDVRQDQNSKQLCIALLEKTMKDEKGHLVPITAFANEILGSSNERVEKIEKVEKKVDNRNKIETDLQSNKDDLTGCIVNDKMKNRQVIDDSKFYEFQTDNSVGLMTSGPNSSIYTSGIALSQKKYETVFSHLENPILELYISKTKRAFARITNVHDRDDNLILISPLVSSILGASKGACHVRICNSLRKIGSIKFTFYGTKKELDENMAQILEEVPLTINAFSYLSLGLVINTELNSGKKISLRVDQLLDENNTPIFAGLIPFGLTDLPFDVEPDI